MLKLRASLLALAFATLATSATAQFSGAPTPPPTPTPAPDSAPAATTPPAAPDPTQPTASARRPLPNAPSQVFYTVNGRRYHQPTAEEQFHRYLRHTFSLASLARVTIRAGIEQARTVPTGWNQDAEGFGKRFGSSAAVSVIDRTTEYGLAAALHEDVYYYVCHKCSAGDKFKNAILSEFTARHGADGHRVASATHIIGNMSGPLIANSFWYPDGYGPRKGAQSAGIGIVSSIGFNVVREFLFDRDRQPTATPPAPAPAPAPAPPPTKTP